MLVIPHVNDHFPQFFFFCILKVPYICSKRERDLTLKQRNYLPTFLAVNELRVFIETESLFNSAVASRKLSV